MSVLDDLAGQTVLVVGDVMLDEYIEGKVRRISPEAPVPVVEQQSVSYFSGGAGDVAANMAALGAEVYLIGAVGRDPQAESLRHILMQLGVNVSGLIPLSARPTTTKTRVVAHSQQMLRLDRERAQLLDEAEERTVIEAISRVIGSVQACVLSDYGKGLLTPRICQAVMAQTRPDGIPVLVDPKEACFDKYAGATVITPNLNEAMQAASGLESVERINLETDEGVELLGKALMARYGGAFLITRGAHGMSVIQPGETVKHIPAQARQVYDVTGAGDTAIAVLALVLAAGLSLEIAARLSNWAAGIVISKLGTATLTPEELQQANLADLM